MTFSKYYFSLKICYSGYNLQQGLQKRKMQYKIVKYDLHSFKLKFEESNNYLRNIHQKQH